MDPKKVKCGVSTLDEINKEVEDLKARVEVLEARKSPGRPKKGDDDAGEK